MKNFIGWILVIAVVFGINYGLWCAVADVSDRVREKEQTYKVYHCETITVEPGRITYYEVQSATWIKKGHVMIVPPGASVSWRATAGPAEPLTLETWTIRGREYIRITTPPGYPLYR